MGHVFLFATSHLHLPGWLPAFAGQEAFEFAICAQSLLATWHCLAFVLWERSALDGINRPLQHPCSLSPSSRTVSWPASCDFGGSSFPLSTSFPSSAEGWSWEAAILRILEFPTWKRLCWYPAQSPHITSWDAERLSGSWGTWILGWQSWVVWSFTVSNT